MNLFSHIFGAVVGARNALYDREILQVRRLEAPVISIGNLSVGGSGKTPFVIVLGELLKARGIEFDVLSRGYGRQSRGTALVRADGSAKEFGDEPLLISRRLGVPVIVGESRYQAGRFAEENLGPRIHLLDDGFQHRALARDFDIVLLPAGDTQDRLLPVGRLREPLSSLKRADAVILIGDTPSEPFALQKKLVWRTRRGITITSAPSRPLVFCGIARPRLFVAQLEELGIHPATTVFFRDHHAYHTKDIEKLVQASKEHSTDGFITTEKDILNLGDLGAALQPLAVAQVRMELENAADAVDTMLRMIEERRCAA